MAVSFSAGSQRILEQYFRDHVFLAMITSSLIGLKITNMERSLHPGEAISIGKLTCLTSLRLHLREDMEPRFLLPFGNMSRLSDLTNLRELRLRSGNFPTGGQNFHESLSQLKQLTFLGLSNVLPFPSASSEGEIINPPAICRLTQLQHLMIGFDAQTTITLPFGQLTLPSGLTALKLSRVTLQGHTDTLAYLPKLQWLYLHRFDLSRPDLEGPRFHMILAMATQLKHGLFTLKRAAALKLELTCLHPLSGLQSLCLQANISNLPIFPTWAGLTSLNVSNNLLHSVPHSLSVLTNLQKLDLRNQKGGLQVHDGTFLQALPRLVICKLRIAAVPQAGGEVPALDYAYEWTPMSMYCLLRAQQGVALRFEQGWPLHPTTGLLF